MKIKLNLQATVKEIQGQKRLVFHNKNYYRQQVNQFPVGQVVEVAIKNKRRQRTSGQNRYWHGVCFPILAEMTGFTEGEIKAYCAQKYIKPAIKEDPITKKEIELRRGTSDLDVSEAWDFTTELIALASSLGGVILTPCEAGYSCGRQDCMTCLEDTPEIEYPEEEAEPVF